MQEIKKINLSLEFETIKISHFVDDMKNGGTPRRNVSKYWENGTIPWLKTGEINNSPILDNSEYITEEGLKKSSAKVLPINSVIMALYGKGTAGRVGLLKFEATTNQACCAMICKDRIKSEYLYYYLLSIQPQIELLANGSVQQNLSKEILADYDINVPKNYQDLKNIVWILKNIDQKIENNKSINKNLDELCHSLFKYYFIDFIPFCDDDFIDSDIGEIPKEWSITTVGNILDCKLGGTPSRSNESYWGGSIAWINSGKVNDFRIIEPSEYITEKGLKKSATKLLPAKTTVIAITGATLGQISLLEIDSCANQSVIGIIPNINYPYEFVYPLISSILIDLLKHQTGGAQQHINKNNVESFKIICPPAEIISEYKTIVSPIYSKISDNCFEIEKLQKLRDTLLPKLMSGEIDVSKINCDLELKYNYMKYLFNQIHKQLSKSVV